MANIPGYPGYAGWDQTAAEADFKATGGAGKGGDSSNGSTYNPISAPDLANMQNQIGTVLQPYYLKLAQQAQGDFTVAVNQLVNDYKQGVKAKVDSMDLAVSQGKADLQGTLDQLGLTEYSDQMKAQSDLGGRGILAVQTPTNGQPVSPQVSTLSSNNDFTNYVGSSNIDNPANPALQGEAGIEMANLQRTEQLKREAAQRATMEPLQAQGLQLKQYTNPTPGFDPNNPGTSTANVDRSQLGTSELQLINDTNSAAQTERNTQEGLDQEKNTQINDLSSQYAGVGQKSLSSELTNQLNQEEQQSFVTNGPNT